MIIHRFIVGAGLAPAHWYMHKGILVRFGGGKPRPYEATSFWLINVLIFILNVFG